MLRALALHTLPQAAPTLQANSARGGMQEEAAMAPVPTQRESGAGRAPAPQAPPVPAPLYTRYCCAPQPAHPVREPSFIHALLAAMWLGRMIDPLPHPHARGEGVNGVTRSPGSRV